MHLFPFVFPGSNQACAIRAGVYGWWSGGKHMPSGSRQGVQRAFRRRRRCTCAGASEAQLPAFPELRAIPREGLLKALASELRRSFRSFRSLRSLAAYGTAYGMGLREGLVDATDVDDGNLFEASRFCVLPLVFASSPMPGRRALAGTPTASLVDLLPLALMSPSRRDKERKQRQGMEWSASPGCQGCVRPGGACCRRPLCSVW